MTKSVLGCVGLVSLDGGKSCCRRRYYFFQGDQPYSDQSLRIAQPLLRRGDALKVDQVTDEMMCRAPECTHASSLPCVKDYFVSTHTRLPLWLNDDVFGALVFLTTII